MKWKKICALFDPKTIATFFYFKEMKSFIQKLKQLTLKQKGLLLHGIKNHFKFH